MRRLYTATLALCSLLPAHSAGAQQPAHDTTSTAAPEPVFSPVVHAMLFGDATYLTTNRPTSTGFFIGQAVGHVVAALTERLAYFGEVTASAQSTGYTFEVERSILRYDLADQLKLTAGRYHTPVGYWNTTFHHGTWLQTTVSRPEMVKYGSQFIPTHFVGAMVEGNLPSGDLGLGYVAGVGNGRGGTISRAGDAGDVNANRAWTTSLVVRPASLYRLQAGGGYYHDRVSPTTGVEAGEGIASAYLAWQSETPELIAEYAQVRHTPVGGGATTVNHGGYAQVAYRLAGVARSWKPYLRAERVTTASDDAIFAPLSLGYRGTVGGVRYDFAPYAALKAEMRREQFQGKDWSTGLYLNASFTIPDLGAGEGPPMAHP
jgi:hypothetical protein